MWDTKNLYDCPYFFADTFKEIKCTKLTLKWKGVYDGEFY